MKVSWLRKTKAELRAEIATGHTDEMSETRAKVHAELGGAGSHLRSEIPRTPVRSHPSDFPMPRQSGVADCL